MVRLYLTIIFQLLQLVQDGVRNGEDAVVQERRAAAAARRLAGD